MAPTTSGPGPGVPFVPGRLIAHFKGRERADQNAGWTSLWDTNQDDLWDRGKPSPALIDLIESRPDLIPPADDGTSGDASRPKALVPGCGRGYDVAMLALHGYDAYGLEVCDRAVQAAREYAAGELAAPSERNFSDGGQQERYVKGGRGIGRAEFVVGDFFSTDWEEAACSREGGRAFDLIYDYTFFCALLPSMRRDWARRMSELLAPSGVLVCLEFPLYKGLQHPGPPWGLREGIYWDVLAAGGDGLIRDEEAARAATRVADGGAFERIAYLKPARSYEIAKGTDMVSVWRLRGWKNRA